MFQKIDSLLMRGFMSCREGKKINNKIGTRDQHQDCTNSLSCNLPLEAHRTSPTLCTSTRHHHPTPTLPHFTIPCHILSYAGADRGRHVRSAYLRAQGQLQLSAEYCPCCRGLGNPPRQRPLQHLPVLDGADHMATHQPLEGLRVPLLVEPD